MSPALRAETYPTRPITLVAVFGAGSASDTVCRVLAQPLGAALKQPVIVEPRPGADGALAAKYVAKANPDGYTLMLATNSPLSADPFLLKDLSYDAVKDFAPVTRVGSFTLMLVINPDIPANSLKELIAYAKANPGKLSFASGNTAGIVAGETLKHWAGIDLLHVPYKSTPPALEDILARPRVDDVRGSHHRDAARQGRHAARARVDAPQTQRAVPRAADHGRGGGDRLRARRVGRHRRPRAHAAGDRDAAQRRAAQDHRQSGRSRQSSRTWASRRSPARPRSSAASSRCSSTSGERWWRTPGSSGGRRAAGPDIERRLHYRHYHIAGGLQPFSIHPVVLRPAPRAGQVVSHRVPGAALPLPPRCAPGLA